MFQFHVWIDNFISEIHFHLWMLHFKFEILVSYTKILHVKFWNSSLHMGIGYFTCEKVCISYAKMFPFQIFFTYEMTWEMLVREACNWTRQQIIRNRYKCSVKLFEICQASHSNSHTVWPLILYLAYGTPSFKMTISSSFIADTEHSSKLNWQKSLFKSDLFSIRFTSNNWTSFLLYSSWLRDGLFTKSMAILYRD